MIVYRRKTVIKNLINTDPETGVQLSYQIVKDQQTGDESAVLNQVIVNLEDDLVLPRYAEDENGHKYPVRTVGSIEERDTTDDDPEYKENLKKCEAEDNRIIWLTPAYFTSSNNRLRSVTFPIETEVISGPLFRGHPFLLTVNLPSTIRFLHKPFVGCRNIEDQLGGLIQYNGTKEDWKALIHDETYEDVHYKLCTEYEEAEGINTYLKWDRTPYWNPDFMINCCPSEDFHIKMDEDYILNDKEKTARIRIMHPEGHFTIPEEYIKEGISYKVTEIGTAAMACNERLASITIPPAIQVIHENAFYGNDALEEIWISYSEEPLIIEKNAFCSCPVKRIYNGRRLVFQINEDSGSQEPIFDEDTINRLETIPIQ